VIAADVVAAAGASVLVHRDQPLDVVGAAICQAYASPPPLTPRESTVLEMLGSGVAPKQVAYRLGISVHTCRGYVKNILRKLDSHSVLEAVVTAQRGGLLPAPSGG
jgi:DNA-binding CsgD family transcriptional regulator